MTETTRIWPLLVVALALLVATASTSPGPRAAVPVHPSSPAEFSCHYHAESLESHCILIP